MAAHVSNRANHTAGAHPLAQAAGRGNYNAGVNPAWLPHEPTVMAAVYRPGSKQPGARAHVRTLRGGGMIPLVVSRREGGDLPLAISERTIMDEVNRGGFFNRTYHIKAEDGATFRVVATHVEYHPLRNTPVTVIFVEYDSNVPRYFNVPVEATNAEKSPGVRSGGHVQMVLDTVPVMALSEEVPKMLPIDVAHLGVKQSTRVRDLQWPENINLLLAGRPEQALVKINGRWK
jgi:large subunit ribosomal protein L25